MLCIGHLLTQAVCQHGRFEIIYCERDPSGWADVHAADGSESLSKSLVVLKNTILVEAAYCAGCLVAQTAAAQQAGVKQQMLLNLRNRTGCGPGASGHKPRPWL
jgi:hypothetical protein